MNNSLSEKWRPKGIWRWLFTAVAVAAFFATLMVGYYVAEPGNFGVFWSLAAYFGLIFPALLLIPALVAAMLSGIAFWSRARLAGVGFGVSALLALLLAAWPPLGMWRMAQTSLNVVYGRAADGTKLLLDIWPAKGPAQGARRPAFVRVHGGAWIQGAKSELPAWDVWLNELGYTVFDVEYRLPPPERWKDEVSDVKCALGWVLENAEKYGIDPSRINVIGFSAGGSLAMLAAYSAGSSEIPPSCQVAAVPIKSVVNLYGPSDLASLYDTTPSPDYVRDAFQKYVGGSVAEFPDRYKAISPLTYVNSQTPPTITVLGLSDRIVPREQAEKLDHALAAAGVVHETYFLPGTDHGFDVNWGSIATQFSRAKIKAFIEKNS
jgi:acetyl esterase/lipase